jgi:hypothetical protein
MESHTSRVRRPLATCGYTIPAALVLLSFGGACDNGEEEASDVQEQAFFGSNDDLAPKLNAAGFARTASSTGSVDLSNPFFASLGTNGRTCGTCHLSGQGWTITPLGVKIRFLLTDGTDLLFMPHDAANATNLDVSTVEARRVAYSQILDRAVIRFGFAVKPTAEFELAAADDPYNLPPGSPLTVFRRPLPITNLKFLSTINWDGRATPPADLTNIRLGMMNQSNGATLNHAQGATALTDAVRSSIVDFQLTLTTAQIWDFQAQSLTARGATGGPDALQTQPFAIGANAPGTPGFTRNVFTIFDAWNGLPNYGVNAQRRQVADGQRIFNTRTFTVTTPTGSFEQTCSGCHSTPNIGSHPVFAFFNIGVSDAARRSPRVPLYTFRNKTTGEMIQSTDPGRAFQTGLWSDMNKFKVPGLRALASRPPFFHDGSAATIRDVVNHYDTRFNIGFSHEEKRNLIKFLEAL